MWLRAYNELTDAEIDTVEIMLMKLYARFGIDDFTDFNMLNSEDYPIMSDLYELIEKEFMAFDNEKKHLYTEEMLQNICLGLHSMCKGAESKYFNGHTNINDSELSRHLPVIWLSSAPTMTSSWMADWFMPRASSSSLLRRVPFSVVPG